MKQVQIQAYGSPDVLQVVGAGIPVPAPGQVLVKVEAVGVNYADLLRRRNTYFAPTPLPNVLGNEAVGAIVAVGAGVGAPYAVGTRVLAILPSGGGYAEYVAAEAPYCVPLPPSIPAAAAAAIFVQGTTAQLIISHLVPDLAGKTLLVHAGASGVGTLLIQLAKRAGAARIIATASSAEKLALAASLGADAGVNYTEAQWPEQVLAANEGQKVDVVFEMVGGEVFNQSFACLAMGGRMVVYGAASHVQGVLHSEQLPNQGHSVLGFNLAYYLTHQQPLWQAALGTIIGLLAQGELRVQTANSFALADAAEAHRQMEARQTTGKVVLVP
ncbi:quinone oxidoreductase family protein [Hymenobacter terrenus]|uniref:quinone oxidoreductase family protein n=1 Tax=Hymenobacter terrenus TaxID=1629124 RepID=UPI00061909AB|nr:zinc-binding dehydrogenase [Hymenobacter terrenus]